MKILDIIALCNHKVSDYPNPIGIKVKFIPSRTKALPEIENKIGTIVGWLNKKEHILIVDFSPIKMNLGSVYSRDFYLLPSDLIPVS